MGRRSIRSVNEPDHRQEATGLLRTLIDRIVPTPTAEKVCLAVDLIGDLAGILKVATNGDRPLIESGLSWMQPHKQEVLVAGQHGAGSSHRLCNHGRFTAQRLVVRNSMPMGISK